MMCPHCKATNEDYNTRCRNCGRALKPLVRDDDIMLVGP